MLLLLERFANFIITNVAEMYICVVCLLWCNLKAQTEILSYYVLVYLLLIAIQM